MHGLRILHYVVVDQGIIDCEQDLVQAVYGLVAAGLSNVKIGKVEIFDE
jgi:hypothetical protein